MEKNNVERMRAGFTVIEICREDLDEIGFDGASVSDGTMMDIAEICADCVFEGVEFWYALKAACEECEVALKENE